MCFENTPHPIDLRQDTSCEFHQTIKAASNYDRAAMRNRATSLRMQAYREAPQAGRELTALIIDRADFLVTENRIDRVRELYALYLADPEQKRTESVVKYVELRCRQLGGPCDLKTEIADDEMPRRWR